MPRRWLFLVFLLATSLTANAETPPLLAAAFRQFQADQNRWAYTETHSHRDKAGQTVRDQVAVIDPSAVYAHQIVPEVINGKAATPAQIAEWARRNDETTRQRQALIERLGGLSPEPDFQLKIFQHSVRPQFDRARVLFEDGSSVTFEIPLLLIDGRPFPEYQLTAQVDKQRSDFLHATFRQTKLIQIKAGKWTDGLIEVHFTRPNPHHATVPSSVVSRATNKPLFGPANQWHRQVDRTDFRRVTPYDERFRVKIGPLRVLGF
jgi:hypothetical protein